MSDDTTSDSGDNQEPKADDATSGGGDNQEPKARQARGQKKGGLTRAQKLTPEARREIASKAAKSRWSDPGSKLPKAKYTGRLKIGDMEIPCAVLDDGRRVLTQEGFLSAIGRSGNPKTGHGGVVFDTPAFLTATNLKPFISEDVLRSSTPVLFQAKSGGMAGRIAYGYPAELLSDVCGVFLDARRANALVHTQEHIADRCELLLRGFAKVGIIALVDEATGYQEDRARDELQRILAAYISPELLPWTRKFPNEFFKQIYRLQGWKYEPGNTQGPRYVGKLINKYIYDRLPPGVKEELERKNPPVNGQRKHKHFQFLTDHTGHPHLDNQILQVTMLMRVSDTKAQFERLFLKAFPAPGDQMELLPEKTEPDDTEDAD